MRSITCGICSKKHKMYGTRVERNLTNISNNGLLYKCRACNASLNIIRLNGEWGVRWIEVLT